MHVLDDTTVVIAERPGNKRADGYLNILANPHIGIISLIPGSTTLWRTTPGYCTEHFTALLRYCK